MNRDDRAEAIAVGFLDPADGGDIGLAGRVADLVNDVYAASETGLWREDARRTDAAEMARLIAAGEIAVATRDDRLAGAIHVQTLPDDLGQFGMLAAAREHRSIGVGRALVDFAERHVHARGMRAMQLELLVPRTWRHPSKAFLDAWYRRIGYRVIRRTSVEDLYPELAPLLATPCEFAVFEKPLTDPR